MLLLKLSFSAYRTSIIPVLRLIRKKLQCKCCSWNKSLKCLRARSPFHLYPCIKYELMSPVTQLSAPPASSPLCNALISGWVTGDPLRLLICSLLFKDLFVLQDYRQCWSQASNHGRELGNWKSFHSFPSAYLWWGCFEGFKSFANIILKLQVLNCLQGECVRENEV